MKCLQTATGNTKVPQTNTKQRSTRNHEPLDLHHPGREKNGSHPIFIKLVGNFTAMKRPKILDDARNPNLIPGIYNYCDQWCERCAFTDRCLNFLGREEERTSGDREDLAETMGQIFDETIELIRYIAEEKGINLDEIEPDPDYEERSERIREEAEDNELATSSNVYAMKVRDWFREAKDLLKEKEGEWNRHLKLGLNEEAILREKGQLEDAIEVVQWYQFQIHVKLMRALSQKDFYEEMGDDDDLQNDADGSAKVALIGMDRSLAAWGVLRKLLLTHADQILDFLVILEKLRRSTEQQFPNARAFVRPGFDTH